MELSLANLPMQISKFYTVLISHARTCTLIWLTFWISMLVIVVFVFKNRTKRIYRGESRPGRFL